MKHTITVKDYAAVTEAGSEHLNVLNCLTDSELSPVDGVAVTGATKQVNDNPFLRMAGIGIRRQPTAEIKRETRGEDSMR